MDDTLRNILDELDAAEAQMTKGVWRLERFGRFGTAGAISNGEYFLTNFREGRMGNAQNDANAKGTVLLRNNYKRLAQAVRDQDERITELTGKSNPTEEE